jgi:DNA-binding XRE family transcriptional regulator
LSSGLIGIGGRLKIIRLEAGYTQSKMAALLDIADRTYKFYELEKRELPLSKAVRFCKIFDLDLRWLAEGKGARKNASDLSLLENSIQATLSEIYNERHGINAEVFAKQVRYVYEQSLESGVDPWGSAVALSKLFPVQK